MNALIGRCPVVLQHLAVGQISRFGARLSLLFFLLLGGLQSAHAITGTVTGSLDERLLLSACDDGYSYPSFTLYLKTGNYASRWY